MINTSNFTDYDFNRIYETLSYVDVVKAFKEDRAYITDPEELVATRQLVDKFKVDKDSLNQLERNAIVQMWCNQNDIIK
ncbi:hypothetical protein M4A92_15750 [Caldibacillus thermoamylovorans]|uniref:hypothetical protein n=1 Tax=Caldibacillus thermoamylovorans TaxID=35841 RepID=UPI00203E59EA|nr:hypothetical protein [Caldibacillus thermoamylovorans]MCM3800049.1 hypothetical protein [Caldibacillus thermoamylovorans]